MKRKPTPPAEVVAELVEVARAMLDLLDMSAGQGKKWAGPFADRCRRVIAEARRTGDGR